MVDTIIREKSIIETKQRVVSVVNTNTINVKDVLLEELVKIDSRKTRKELDEWLIFNLGTETFCSWSLFQEETIVGLVLAEFITGGDIYVAYLWAKSGISIEPLMIKIEEWAKTMNAKRLIKYTDKNPATYLNKYGWEIHQIILTKQVFPKEIQNELA